MKSICVYCGSSTGTDPEFAEVARKLLHSKPIATLDVNGYWSPFHEFLRAAVEAGLMKPENPSLVVNVPTVAELLPALRDYAPPRVPKWATLDEA